MAAGIRIRIFDKFENTEILQEFSSLPVRIGRSPLNDLHIPNGIISQFHAVIEEDDTGLTIRDLGSTNGIDAGEGAVRGVSLHFSGVAEFKVFQLEFSIDRIIAPATKKAKTNSALRSTSVFLSPFVEAASDAALGTPAHTPHQDPIQAVVSESATPLASPSPGITTSDPRVSVLNAEHHFTDPAYLQLFDELSQLEEKVYHIKTRIAQNRAQLENDGSKQLEEHIKQRFSVLAPALLPESSASIPPPASVVASPTYARSTGDQMIREGLAEIFSNRSNGRLRLQSDTEFATALESLNAFFDTFFISFIPLREGFDSMISDLSITGERRTRVSSPAFANSQALFESIFSPASDNAEALRNIKATFADLMIHQVAMLSGVNQGVRSVIDELSPASITRSAEAQGGLGIGPFRYKKLWDTFELAYRDLAEDEKRIFHRLFGRDFAAAYAQRTGETQC